MPLILWSGVGLFIKIWFFDTQNTFYLIVKGLKKTILVSKTVSRPGLVTQWQKVVGANISVFSMSVGRSEERHGGAGSSLRRPSLPAHNQASRWVASIWWWGRARKLLQQKVVSEDDVFVDYHFTILTFTCVIILTGRQQYGQPTTQQGTKYLNMGFGPASQGLCSFLSFFCSE